MHKLLPGYHRVTCTYRGFAYRFQELRGAVSSQASVDTMDTCKILQCLLIFASSLQKHRLI